MTHDQDPNLTGAGADPISGRHSGRLYQSDGHGPEFSLSEIQGVAVGSGIESSTSSFVTIFHLPAARPTLATSDSNEQTAERRRKERRRA